MVEAIRDSYEAVPYESSPFHETHPGFLAPLARLYGVEAASPEKARVLELGCASGGNLIPMAWHHPAGRYLGIDLSGSQVRAGQALVEALELDNIELRQGDILQLEGGLGEFDYIIAHGVYSWAPRPVRERILRLGRDCLTENGVIYISYNTLPGWRMRGMLRDMLLYHARSAGDPAARLEAAWDLLDFLERAMHGLGALSARYLRAEIERIRSNHPSYLYHEYLEETNDPFLFSRFVADAESGGLRYLCDTELHGEFPSTYGEAGEALSERLQDRVELGQYLDFLANRNFRQSLLCRADRARLPALDPEHFADFALYANVRAPRKLDLQRARKQQFTAASGDEFPVHHPLTKAALAHLGSVYPDSVGFDTLFEAARSQVRKRGSQALADAPQDLFAELFSLFAHQRVGASPEEERFFRAAGARPQATRLARTQAAMGLGHVATVRHAVLNLDSFSARLIGYLDGSRTREEITEALVIDILERKDLILPDTEALSGTRDKVTGKVAAGCERLIGLFERHGVLEG